MRTNENKHSLYPHCSCYGQVDTKTCASARQAGMHGTFVCKAVRTTVCTSVGITVGMTVCTTLGTNVVLNVGTTTHTVVCTNHSSEAGSSKQQAGRCLGNMRRICASSVEPQHVLQTAVLGDSTPQPQTHLVELVHAPSTETAAAVH